jgi:hypothetical protein
MEYQSRQIKKPVLEVGDRVTYTHPIPDLGTLLATMAATIIAKVYYPDYSIVVTFGGETA